MTVTEIAKLPNSYSVSIFHLLPNGKVLIHTNGASNYILEPDSSGSYTNGILRRIADSQYNHLYGTQSISNDGRLYIYPGEYPTSVGLDRASTTVFDPSTEKFTTYDQTIAATMCVHAANALADDGRIYSGFHITNSGVSRPGDTSSSGVSFYLSFGFNVNQPFNEAPLVMLPDGRSALIITEVGNPGYPNIFLLAPAYSSEMVAQGSWPNQTSFITSGFNRATLRAIRQNSPVDWRLPNTEDIHGGRWCSTGSGLSTNSATAMSYSGVFYEIGAAFWHPGIQRLVLITGLNFIMSFGLTLNWTLTPRVDAMAPNTPLYPSSDNQSYHLGTVSSNHVGQSLTSIVNSGSFSFVLAPEVPAEGFTQSLNSRAEIDDPSDHYTKIYRKAIYIRLANNTRWARIHYATASYSGNTITLSGLTTPIYPGDYNTLIASGDQIVHARPSYEARDAPAVILPNGHVVYAAGVDVVDRNESFNTRSRLLKWDTGSNISFLSSDPKTIFGGPEYGVRMCLLPTGEVIYNDAALTIRIYTPTNEELTPISGHRPTITSLSSTSVLSGGKFTLTGTQLTGLHEGAFWGDDNSARTNIPIVRLRSISSGLVYYCRTRDYTYRGIQPNRASSCSVILPPNVPPGAYQIELTVNGILATTTPTINVLTDAAETIFMPYS